MIKVKNQEELLKTLQSPNVMYYIKNNIIYFYYKSENDEEKISSFQFVKLFISKCKNCKFYVICLNLTRIDLNKEKGLKLENIKENEIIQPIIKNIDCEIKNTELTEDDRNWKKI